MRTWWKVLVVLCLVAPMTAYVAATLVSTASDRPADRGPVILDAPTTPAPGTGPTRSVPTTPPVPQAPAAEPRDDHSARVVKPSPTPVDDDDDPDDDAGDDDTTDDTTDRDDEDEADEGGDD